jgi:hypothetical protein
VVVAAKDLDPALEKLHRHYPAAKRIGAASAGSGEVRRSAG